MKNKFKYMLILLFPIIVSCQNVFVNSENKFTFLNTIILVAESKNYNDYNIKFNQDSTAAIVVEVKKPSSQKPFPTKRFFIYSKPDDSIIYEDSIAGGSVNWLDNQNVIIKTVPRQIKLDEMIKDEKIYNIQKKRFQTK